MRPDPDTIANYIRGNNKFRSTLDDVVDSGAFENGCLIVARALQLMFGGEIVVLVRSDDFADHAAVRLPDGRLIDADGPASPGKFIARFNRDSFFGISNDINVVGFRPILPGDLAGVSFNEEVSWDLVDILRRSRKSTQQGG